MYTILSSIRKPLLKKHENQHAKPDNKSPTCWWPECRKHKTIPCYWPTCNQQHQTQTQQQLKLF